MEKSTPCAVSIMVTLPMTNGSPGPQPLVQLSLVRGDHEGRSRSSNHREQAKSAQKSYSFVHCRKYSRLILCKLDPPATCRFYTLVIFRAINSQVINLLV